jgi:hypothetical protein
MDILTRYLNNISDARTAANLKPLFEGLCDALSSQMLQTAGLVIKAGGSALVKSGGSAAKVLADGKLVNIAAATDMAALSGTVTNAKFNVFAYFIDSAGTLSSAMGKEAATLAAVKFPTKPQKKTMVGFTIINPTGTGDFVGGTTAIDDATVVPNAVHVSPVGPIDSTAQI